MAGPSRSHQVLSIAARLDQVWPGLGYGQEFINLASANPTWSITRLEDAFAAQIALKGGSAALQQELQTGAAVTGQALTGAAGGAAKAAHNLTSLPGWNLIFGNTGGLLVRSLKVIVGGVLILSGIIRLSGADKAALGVAGKAAVFA